MQRTGWSLQRRERRYVVRTQGRTGWSLQRRERGYVVRTQGRTGWSLQRRERRYVVRTQGRTGWSLLHVVMLRLCCECYCVCSWLKTMTVYFSKLVPNRVSTAARYVCT